MRAEERELSSADAFERRAARRPRPRRPWTLVAAALLLAMLSIILWGNWRTARSERDRLDAELKKVYAEAEALRMEAALAKQRINQLEQQLRVLSGRSKNGVLPSAQQPGGQARPAGTKNNGGRPQSP
jgi:cytochrome c-type biogenesis protein CcmH/NrfG